MYEEYNFASVMKWNKVSHKHQSLECIIDNFLHFRYCNNGFLQI